MKCPFCGNDEDKVVDSRPAKEGRAIRRRRECSICNHRYTTYEAPEEQVVSVLKSNGTRETLDRGKIYRGILIACNKRPITVRQIEQMTNAVDAAAHSADGQEVTSRMIGEWIMEQLSAVDEVAYVRFASVFNRYENIEEFTAELQRLRGSMRNSSQRD